MDAEKSRRDAQELTAAQFAENLEQDTCGESMSGEPQAWELVDAEAGRYMPRRIRGSFRGRALG